MCVHASVKGVLDAMDHELQVVLSHVDMNSRNQRLLLFNSTIVEPSLQSIDNGLLVNNVKYLKMTTILHANPPSRQATRLQEDLQH